jgi:hypothetical protein
MIKVSGIVQVTGYIKNPSTGSGNNEVGFQVFVAEGKWRYEKVNQ